MCVVLKAFAVEISAYKYSKEYTLLNRIACLKNIEQNTCLKVKRVFICSW